MQIREKKKKKKKKKKAAVVNGVANPNPVLNIFFQTEKKKILYIYNLACINVLIYDTSQIKTSVSLTYCEDEVWCAQSEVELCGQNLFGLIDPSGDHEHQSALVHQLVHVLLILQSPRNSHC